MKISSIKKLSQELELKEDEKKWVDDGLNLLISSYYFSLIDKNNINDPIRKQVVPSNKENIDDRETLDPQNEKNHSIFPRLVHRYKNRVALLVTDKCLTYCRHCFRRRFSSNSSGVIKKEDLDIFYSYLKEMKEVNEVLLTGGDPLTLSDNSLLEIINNIKSIRSDILIRICTRVVVTEPKRITKELLRALKESRAHLVFMTQFNHPKEITGQSIKAIRIIQEQGFLIFNQSVLLKDINDNYKILKELFTKLSRLNVILYYLFQADLVKGTYHFRVPLKKGIEIYEKLEDELSGITLPSYAVDLPKGGGKILVLSKRYLGEEEKGVHLFKGKDGKIYKYRD